MTHTRIGDKDLNIYGGVYDIKEEKLKEFYKLYYDEVINNKQNEYSTEVQIKYDYPTIYKTRFENNEENTVFGAMLIDLDFRYSSEIKERQHDENDINNIIFEYTNILSKYLKLNDDSKFNVYVFEKPNVNTNNKEYTKDGIHIIFGIQVDHILQQIIRNEMISILPNVIDLPLINKWEDVLDDCISNGINNWQMYGSRKPNNEAYVLVKAFKLTYIFDDDEFDCESV